MDLAALSLCSITTQASCTLQPNVQWNAKSPLCSKLATVNSTTCQVGLNHTPQYETSLLQCMYRATEINNICSEMPLLLEFVLHRESKNKTPNSCSYLHQILTDF